MPADIREKIKALPVIQKHLINSYQKRLEWARVTITILTPSLVLLVGLQDKPKPDETTLNIFLLTSIILISVTILIGLWLLLGEAEAHNLAVGDIKEWVESGKPIDDMQWSVNFQKHQQIFLRFFPALVWVSVLSICLFGVLKFKL
jgi:hypothetical protein